MADSDCAQTPVNGIWVAVLAACFGSACFGIASVWQHRVADDAPRFGGGIRNNLGVAFGIVRSPKWIAGGLFDVLGFSAHVFALGHGPIAIVQPILVTGLLVAIVAASVVERRSVAPLDLFWALSLIIALSGFLLIAQPAAGTSSVSGMGSLVAGAILAVVVCAGIVVARNHWTMRPALIWGAITGVIYGYCAALMKLTAASLANGVLSTVFSWPLYALIICGAIGFYCNQLAFQAGKLSMSLGAITAVDPLVAVALGIVLFDERIHADPVRVGAELVAAAVMVVATMQLAGSKAKREAV